MCRNRRICSNRVFDIGHVSILNRTVRKSIARDDFILLIITNTPRNVVAIEAKVEEESWLLKINIVKRLKCRKVRGIPKAQVVARIPSSQDRYKDTSIGFSSPSGTR